MNERPFLRTVVEERSFAEDLNDLMHKYDGMDEVKRCIDWMVARNPLQFDQVIGFSDYYILKTTDVEAGIAPIPSFRVLLKYSEEQDVNNVYLIAIEGVPVAPEEE